MRAPGAIVAAVVLFSLAQTCVAQLAFARRTLYDAPFAAAISDVNGDGASEVPGLINIPGRFVGMAPARLGFGDLFQPVPAAVAPAYPFPFTRLSRDTRAADLNNDGLPDLVNNVYACNADPFSATQLYFQRRDGTFGRDQSFDLIGPIRGRGETIVAADFDNDGYLDLYIPQYTRADDSIENFGSCARFPPMPSAPRSWLLMNRGSAAPGAFVAAIGTPVDLTVANCGTDCANSGSAFERYAQPEGAQAIDYDEDGNVDLFVNGILFRNSGAATFARVWPPRGVIPAFDEGLRFLDWNNDGYPDFAAIEPNSGVVHLYAWTGGMRNASGIIVGGSLAEVTDAAIVGEFARNAARGTYGMTTGDVNGDGYEDIIVNGSSSDLLPKIYLNQGPPGYGFRRAAIMGLTWPMVSSRSGPSVGDLDGDGLGDILFTGQYGNRTMFAFYNTTPHPPLNTLLIEVLGAYGGRLLQNQQGRTVHVRPSNAGAGFVYSRYVDGGSGYMTQSAYPITLASRFSGVHVIEVRYASRVIRCQASPPAYVIITDAPGEECTALPLPQPRPIPRGHDVRPLMSTFQMILN